MMMRTRTAPMGPSRELTTIGKTILTCGTTYPFATAMKAREPAMMGTVVQMRPLRMKDLNVTSSFAA